MPVTITNNVLNAEKVFFIGCPLSIVMDLVDCTNVESLKNKSILNCPGGPSTATKELLNLGINSVAIDPMYINNQQQLQDIALKDFELLIAKHMERKKQFPDYAISNEEIETHFNILKKAFPFFIEDYEEHKKKGHYQAASLPTLPFKDHQFDICWSTNLLFLYSHKQYGGASIFDTLSYQWHVESIIEILRVAKEVYITPVSKCYVNESFIHHDFLSPILALLHEKGFSTHITKVLSHSAISHKHELCLHIFRK